MLYTSNGFIMFNEVMYHEVANCKTCLPMLEKKLENNPFIKNLLSLLPPEEYVSVSQMYTI